MLLGTFSEAQVLSMKKEVAEAASYSKMDPVTTGGYTVGLPFFNGKNGAQSTLLDNTAATSSAPAAREVSVCAAELPFQWNGQWCTKTGMYSAEVQDPDGSIRKESLVLTVHNAAVYYPDSDGDGFGNANSPKLLCDPLPGYVTNASDCDDSDPAARQPVEYFVDSDRDGFGSDVVAIFCSATAPVGFSTLSADCDDNNASVHPKSAIRCRGIANELNQPSFSVYPNPGTGKFNLSWQNLKGEVNIQVFNVQGVLVMEKQISDAMETGQVNLEDQPSGLYWVKCNARGFEESLRVSKK